MLYIIFLGITIALQLVSTVIAIRLIRHTKFNASWILITIALSILMLQRVDEFIMTVNTTYNLRLGLYIPYYLRGVTGVTISLCLAVAMMTISRLFVHLRRTNEQRLRSERRILKAVIAAQEHERERLAKELHDGLGPLLSTAKLSLSALDRYPDNPQILTNAKNTIDLSIATLREVSNNLSPHVLTNFGLEKALTNLLRNLPPELKVDFRHNLGERRFTQERELALYRIASELLNNTLKHSGASSVLLSLTYSAADRATTLEYRDDGCGFDVDETPTGMGLSGIQSRVDSLSGELNLNSSPGRGIDVIVKLSTSREPS